MPGALGQDLLGHEQVADGDREHNDGKVRHQDTDAGKVVAVAAQSAKFAVLHWYIISSSSLAIAVWLTGRLDLAEYPTNRVGISNQKYFIAHEILLRFLAIDVPVLTLDASGSKAPKHPFGALWLVK